jgi:hypothetical protein
MYPETVKTVPPIHREWRGEGVFGFSAGLIFPYS